MKNPGNGTRMVRHAVTMMGGTLVSRVLGLAREVVTAAMFGATAGLDAFFVAFALSNMARQMLAEGALSAAFVPVFTDALAQGRRDRAAHLARQGCTLLLFVGGVVVLAGMVCAPLLARIMAPGFQGATYDAAVSMTRQLFPFLLFVSLAALAMGALNSLGRFLTSSLAPALSNLLYILIALLLGPVMGLKALVIAVLVGGFAQMALQVFWLGHVEGMTLRPVRPDFSDPDLRRMLSLFLPFALGLSINQLNPVLTRAFGSFLTGGSISVLNYSNRVIQLPLGLVVIAISQALLPALSGLKKDREAFVTLLRQALAFTAFLVLPVTLGTMFTAGPISDLLFRRGAFDQFAWRGTTSTLFWSALGLPAMAVSTVCLRGLYALELRRAPLQVAGANVLALFVSCFFLSPLMDVDGVALGGTLAFYLSAGLSLWLLRRRLGCRPWPGWDELQGPVGATLGVAVLLVFWPLCWPYPYGTALISRVLWFVFLGGAAVTVYSALALALCPRLLTALRGRKEKK